MAEYRERLAALTLGDYPGHPFRGNQWTVGEDEGGGTLSSRERGLQERLVDYKDNRKLTGPDSKHITEAIPGGKFTHYVRVPGLDALHESMDVEPSVATDPAEYTKARDEVFDKMPEERIPFRLLTYTQPRVNAPQYERLAKTPEHLNKPVHVIKHGDKYYVMNGHHRVVASHYSGRKEILAKVFDAENPPPPKRIFEEEHARKVGRAIHQVVSKYGPDWMSALARAHGKGYLPKMMEGTLDPALLSSVMNLPDIADVSFPTMIGSLKKPRRKKVRYKGVTLSRKPTKFEAKVLDLVEIPRRLDFATTAILDGDIEFTLQDIAEYGASEVLAELVRQGADPRLLNFRVQPDLSDMRRRMADEQTMELSALHAQVYQSLKTRKLSDTARTRWTEVLIDRRRPALERKHAAHMANEAFAFGRETAIRLFRRSGPEAMHLAGPYRDADGKFISIADAIAGGDILVDAVVQTAVMDLNTCEPCEEVDGEVMDFGSDRQLELDPPYVGCLGGKRCRCQQVAILDNGQEIDVDEIEEDTLED